MAVIEESFVGLEPNAEEHLPPALASAKERGMSLAAAAAFVAVELVWLALFAYAAYRFIF